MSLETKDVVNGIKRRPVLSTCVVLSVVLGALLYFRMGVPAEIQAKLEEREKELVRVSNNVKFSAQLEAQLQALKTVNTAIEGGALRPAELARNQQLFFQLEAESGVKLLDLRQQTSASAAKAANPAAIYSTIVFSLSIQGEYAQLLDFLKRLERSATLSRVRSASMGQAVEGIQSISLTVELLGLRS